MKIQLSHSQAINELMKLKALNDGKEYCMTLDPWAKGKNKWRVGEKTITQKEIDASDPVLANTKVTDFVSKYDHKQDIR